MHRRVVKKVRAHRNLPIYQKITVYFERFFNDHQMKIVIKKIRWVWYFFQNIQRYFLFCIEWIYGALFHISTTLCDVKKLKDKFVTLFKVNSFWLHIHSMPWTFKKNIFIPWFVKFVDQLGPKFSVYADLTLERKNEQLKSKGARFGQNGGSSVISVISSLNPLMLLINICPRHLLGYLRTFCFTLEIFLLAYKIQWRPSDFHCC